MEMIVRFHSRAIRLREAEAGTGTGIGIETEGSAAGPSRANVPAELDDLWMVHVIGTINPTEEGIVNILAAGGIHGKTIGDYSSLFLLFLLAVWSVKKFRIYLFRSSQ
jgi:hypothetical protein